MAMTLGGGRDKYPQPTMNVTPLVDVVLVLLIIFLVITPQLTKRFWVHVPKQEKEVVEKRQLLLEPEPPLVLHIAADQSLTVNGAAVTRQELSDRLQRMFAARADHLLFFDADDEVDYGFAVEIMDQARAGGALSIAPLMAAITKLES